jgi:DNA-binding response OmpR family regulator
MLNVLLIEDDRLLGQGLRSLLVQQGYAATRAGDLRTASLNNMHISLRISITQGDEP